MSTDPTYTITLTAAERDAVMQALAATPHGRDAEAGDAAFYKLKAAKPKAARKPAAAKRPAIKWQSPGLPPLKPMKVSEQDAAESAWRFECDQALADVQRGEMPRAERHLRDLIALHSGQPDPGLRYGYHDVSTPPVHVSP